MWNSISLGSYSVRCWGIRNSCLVTHYIDVSNHRQLELCSTACSGYQQGNYHNGGNRLIPHKGPETRRALHVSILLDEIGGSSWPLPWASGLPVAIQCAWNLDPSVHWNATGEMPEVFQWSSSGFPVVFQCVPIMQINTGSPLEHHWVLASASVAPVASQCTCGSSGLPVCSNYAN